jgi:hypothetical protein
MPVSVHWICFRFIRWFFMQSNPFPQMSSFKIARFTAILRAFEFLNETGARSSSMKERPDALTEAARNSKIAADQGDADGQYRYGVYLKKGAGGWKERRGGSAVFQDGGRSGPRFWSVQLRGLLAEGRGRCQERRGGSEVFQDGGRSGPSW